MEQAGDAGCRRTRRQQRQALVARPDKGFLAALGQFFSAQQIAEPPGVGHLENFVQPPLAQIAVDQQDGPADFGERQRQVARHRRLPLPRVGAGQHDHARAVTVLPGIQNGGHGGAEAVGQNREVSPRGDQFHLRGVARGSSLPGPCRLFPFW